MFVPSFAQNGEVDGYVHEQGTSLPINKAIITISNQKSSVLYSCVTNKEGKFHLSTKGEELSLFILKVSCMGYKTASCPMGNKKKFSYRTGAQGICLEGCLCESPEDYPSQ